MWVLDTNTLIYFFKGFGRVAENILSRPPSDIAVPSIVLFELRVGIEKSVSPEKRTAQLVEFTSQAQILPFGEAEAICAAATRADLEQRGKPIGPHDILIAATALSNNAALVTHNTKEFCRIENLTVEDWY
jgi:tRNA(fMet)-specific endonuclease VapC